MRWDYPTLCILHPLKILKQSRKARKEKQKAATSLSSLVAETCQEVISLLSWPDKKTAGQMKLNRSACTQVADGCCHLRINIEVAFQKIQNSKRGLQTAFIACHKQRQLPGKFREALLEATFTRKMVFESRLLRFDVRSEVEDSVYGIVLDETRGR